MKWLKTPTIYAKQTNNKFWKPLMNLSTPVSCLSKLQPGEELLLSDPDWEVRRDSISLFTVLANTPKQGSKVCALI